MTAQSSSPVKYKSASYSVGSFPLTVVTGDFRKNGTLDLAVTNCWSNTVSVLLGNGNGTFQTQKSYNIGPSPSGLIAGDFNGDGFLDLAVGNSSNGTISVLVNNGDGTFTPGPAYKTNGNSAMFLAMGDFYRNGYLDLAVPNGNSITIMKNDGRGAFSVGSSYPVGEEPEVIAVGDFRNAVGDFKGVLDLVVANVQSNSLTILFGNGDGTFGITPSGSGVAPLTIDVAAGPFGVAVGDLNRDGWLDIAFTSAQTNQVGIIFNDKGRFLAPLYYPVGPSPSFLALGDLNQDDYLDIIITTVNYKKNGLLQKNDGSFEPVDLYGPLSLPPQGITIGDFNTDGRNDLAVACTTLPPTTKDNVTVLLQEA